MSTTHASTAAELDDDLRQRFEPQLHCPFMQHLSKVVQASRKTATESPDVTENLPDEELAAIHRKAVERAMSNLQWPAMPSIVEELDNVLSSPDACAADIAEVVSLDIGLTARLLSLVNSAVYGLKREIHSIEQSVALLGSEQVRNAALAISVVASFSKTPAPGFDVPSFWRHSLAVAMGAGMFGKVLRDRGDTVPDSGKLFLAGLMHDIGRVVIAQQLPEQFSQIREAVRMHNVSFLDAEVSFLGTRHTNIGQQLLTGWHMDATVCNAAAFHHQPAEDDVVSAIVHCADVIAHGLGFSPEGCGLLRTDPEIWNRMNFTNESVRAVGARLIEQMGILTKTLLD